MKTIIATLLLILGIAIFLASMVARGDKMKDVVDEWKGEWEYLTKQEKVAFYLIATLVPLGIATLIYLLL